jgi:ADP-ribose pyrophosphatase YjhB (NUDIX family)
MQEAMSGEETGGTPTWPPRMVVCVGSIVLRGQRALFVRQAPGHSLAGQWSIPWGIVDQGETPEDAALRETYEESRISARIEGLAGIQNLPQASWLGVVFLCHHVEGEPLSDGVETDRAAYFSLEEIDAFREPFEPWCEWLVRRVLVGEYRVIPRALNNPYAPRRGFL